jgi:hypothetical protein
MQDVAARTDGELRLSPRTLYGSMKRMLEQGLIMELGRRDRPDENDERRRSGRDGSLVHDNRRDPVVPGVSVAEPKIAKVPDVRTNLLAATAEVTVVKDDHARIPK